MGVPAASKCPSANSGTRIRSAARSASDRFHVWTRSSQPALSTGAERFHSVIDCSARRRSASSSRANDAAGSGATPSSSACTPTTSRQRAPGSSESANRATPSASSNPSDRWTTVRPENAPSEKISDPLVPRSGGWTGGSVSSAGSPKPGSRLLTTKMSAKSAASSSPSSTSTRRWLWFWTTIRSSMQSPTKRSRSITSSFGRRPAASGFRSTNEARCGVEWSCERGSRRAPPSVSTERERKRVSEAKKPDAVARPSTSPRSSQTQKVEPSRTVRGKPTRLFRLLADSPRRRATPSRAARRRSRSPLPATAARPGA